MSSSTPLTVRTGWFKSRSEAYLEILGTKLYSQLNARERGLIYWYSKEFRAACGGELGLLLMIRQGIISIAQIIEAHQRRKETK